MSHQGCKQQQREESSSPGRCHREQEGAGPRFGRGYHGPRHSDRSDHHCERRSKSPGHHNHCERSEGPPAYGSFMDHHNCGHREGPPAWGHHGHHGHHRGMGRHGMRGHGMFGPSFNPFGRPAHHGHGPCRHNNDNEHHGGATSQFHRGPHFGKHHGHHHFGKHHEGGCRFAQRRHSIDVATVGANNNNNCC